MSESTRSSFESEFSLDDESHCVNLCRPRSIFRTIKYLSFLSLCIFLLFFFTHNPTSSTPQEILPSTPFQQPSSGTTPPPPPNDASRARIGKVTASFGPSDPTYEAAISSHTIHDTLHNYPHFILRERILPGLWSKHAFLLTILGSELAKPPRQRLQWLFWHDRDTILMNPNIPLEIFLPPHNNRDQEIKSNGTGVSFKDINMILTNDRNGLNNGVFFIRINAWALKFMATALSLQEYDPDVKLKYSEQSAMELVSKRPHFTKNIIHVPQRWFNGYPPPSSTVPLPQPPQPSAARPGSLLIHFASNRDGQRPARMAHWGQIARSHDSAWNRALNQTRYDDEIREFWERLGKGEEEESVVRDIGARTWD